MKHEEVSAPATDAQIKALEQCVRNLAKRMGVPAESVQVTGLTFFVLTRKQVSQLITRVNDAATLVSNELRRAMVKFKIPFHGNTVGQAIAATRREVNRGSSSAKEAADIQIGSNLNDLLRRVGVQPNANMHQNWAMLLYLLACPQWATATA